MNATTTPDAIPTQAQLWQALRVLFGSKLLAASVTVLNQEEVGGSVVFSTYTFPTETT